MIMHTLGTSAGTQPYAGFHHTSLALETDNALYWFDTGECCAYTAHICGIDLHKTRAVFITHPHMDHVGGLGNLLWYIRKLLFVKNREKPCFNNIDIFSPCLETVSSVFKLLKHTEGNFECNYNHSVHKTIDGLVFVSDVDDLKVYAIHTNHMEKNDDGTYQSFAYRIETGNKTIFYTGDMNKDDFPDIIPEHTDCLFVETGHHLPEDICKSIIDSGKYVGKVFFVHNRGSIMQNVDSAIQTVESFFGKNAVICTDGSKFEL